MCKKVFKMKLILIRITDLWSHHDFRALNNVALLDGSGGISAELRYVLSPGVSSRM